MAVIDETRGVLVVRIVYDGPALSGKTTSLKALARGVSREVTTPGEIAGRTLFFDWVDYIGGMFDGRQIRCQILSLPGQRELAERRHMLLRSADAVVLVLDTTEHEWDFSLRWVKESVAYCRQQDPPLGLVLQANKRDAPDAVAAEVMRQALAKIAPVALVSSTATAGDGIREAFVLAVRLALDRVRALASSRRLLVGLPPEDSPQELLDKMLDAERARQPGVQTASAEVASRIAAQIDQAELGLRGSSVPPPPSSSQPPRQETPFVPDPMMPGGMIWPPVDGRALLHEVASLGIRPTRRGRSDWAGSGSGFRFHSASNALFPDLHTARNELIEWARLHAANTAHLSPGRAVILADAGGGRLRLWQIVRAEAALRERLASALHNSEPALVAKELLSVASALTAARESFSQATLPLPCTLWTVGAYHPVRPTFVGLMPARDADLAPEPTGAELLRREVSPQLRELRRSRVDYAEVVSQVEALASLSGSDSTAAWLADIVRLT